MVSRRIISRQDFILVTATCSSHSVLQLCVINTDQAFVDNYMQLSLLGRTGFMIKRSQKKSQWNQIWTRNMDGKPKDPWTMNCTAMLSWKFGRILRMVTSALLVLFTECKHHLSLTFCQVKILVLGCRFFLLIQLYAHF